MSTCMLSWTSHSPQYSIAIFPTGKSLHIIFTGGEDYTSGPYNVTFTAGGTIALLTIPINDDKTFEGNENFTLTIDSSSLPSDVTVINPSQITVTVIEDEGNKDERLIIYDLCNCTCKHTEKLST